MNPNPQQRILVVDDEAGIRDLLCEFFRRRGYETSATHSAIGVVELAEEWKPDLVILDLALPDGDGMEVLADLRQRIPSMPVIILTGMGFDEDLFQEAKERGAYGYVSKTLPLEQLHMEVRRAIKGQYV